MEKTLNRTELEQQLSGKADSIARRIDALQEEVGGLSVRKIVSEKPWVALAATVAGGLAVGLLFGGRGKSRRGDDAFHRALVEGYIEAVSEDVQRIAGKGRETSEAVAEALRDRVPLLVYAPEPELTSRGFFAQVADLAFKTAVGFAVKAAIDYATERVNLEELLEEVAAEAGDETATASGGDGAGAMQ